MPSSIVCIKKSHKLYRTEVAITISTINKNTASDVNECISLLFLNLENGQIVN